MIAPNLSTATAVNVGEEICQRQNGSCVAAVDKDCSVTFNIDAPTQLTYLEV